MLSELDNDIICTCASCDITPFTFWLHYYCQHLFLVDRMERLQELLRAEYDGELPVVSTVGNVEYAIRLIAVAAPVKLYLAPN